MKKTHCTVIIAKVEICTPEIILLPRNIRIAFAKNSFFCGKGFLHISDGILVISFVREKFSYIAI